MKVEDHRLQRATSDGRARDRRRVEDHRLKELQVVGGLGTGVGLESYLGED